MTYKDENLLYVLSTDYTKYPVWSAATMISLVKDMQVDQQMVCVKFSRSIGLVVPQRLDCDTSIR